MTKELDLTTRERGIPQGEINWALLGALAWCCENKLEELKEVMG